MRKGVLQKPRGKSLNHFALIRVQLAKQNYDPAQSVFFSSAWHILSPEGEKPAGNREQV